MTRDLDHLAAQIGVSAEEVTIWVERRWVLPAECGGALEFSDADRARLRMIAEFRRDLGIEDESMPVVLDLIDRLHGVRERLRNVLNALRGLPVSEQEAFLRRMAGDNDA